MAADRREEFDKHYRASKTREGIDAFLVGLGSLAGIEVPLPDEDETQAVVLW